jgi:hypothetical protein
VHDRGGAAPDALRVTELLCLLPLSQWSLVPGHRRAMRAVSDRAWRRCSPSRDGRGGTMPCPWRMTSPIVATDGLSAAGMLCSRTENVTGYGMRGHYGRRPPDDADGTRPQRDRRRRGRSARPGSVSVSAPAPSTILARALAEQRHRGTSRASACGWICVAR